MIKLKDFLNGNDNVLFEGEDGRYFGIMKIATQYPNIYYIYKSSYLDEKIFSYEELKDYNFYGIYNKENNTLHLYSSFERDDKRIDTEDINVFTISEMLRALVERVNDTVFETIGFDEEKLNVSKKDKDIDDDYLTRRSIDTIVNEKMDELDSSYADYKITDYNKEYLTMKCILNKEETVKEEVEKYIENNKERLYHIITFRKAMKERIEELKNDEDLLMKKEISNILKDKTRKTLNIKYLKDEKEMSFKIENIGSLIDNKYISKYRIVGKKDTEKYEKTYKTENYRWGEDIFPKYIEEITYGKKVLYSKKDFLESLNK